MKHLLLTIALMGAVAPQIARADEPIVVQAPAVAALATVTPFIENLKEPQGLASMQQSAAFTQNDIIVCDYGAGEVLRYSATGEKKGVLATELKGPTQIQIVSGRVLVSERKANRIVALGFNKEVSPLGGEIIEPMGLLYDGSLASSKTNYRIPLLSDTPVTEGLLRTFVGMYAIAHTTSKIYRLDKTDWKLVYSAPDEDGDTSRYGLRCLAADGDTLFVSDEVNGDILMISRGGHAAKFASGFADPSGMEIRGDWLYVCDEGNGGQLWKVDKNGRKILVAEKLGRPRNVLFLDDTTALVSDRDGRVLKLNWAN